MTSSPDSLDAVASTASALPTEPLSIGGVLDTGIRLFRQNFKELFTVAAITAVPYALLSAVMNSRMVGVDVEADPDVAFAAAMQSLAFIPIIYVLLVFIASCVIHRQVSLTRGEPTSLMADFAVGLKLLIPLTLLFFLYFIIVGVGLVLLIVPGVIFMISMCFFLYVPQVEDRGVWGSLWRSHKLVWGGNWWRTAIVLTVVSIIGMVLSVVAYFGLGALAFADATAEAGSEASTLRLLVEFAINWMIMALVLPLSTSVMYVAYNDLMLRKEGGDLEAQLEGLSSPSQN